MPLRAFMRFFTNNPHLIEQLSNSWPIRSAARVVARVLITSRYRVEDALQKKTGHDLSDLLQSPKEKFRSFTDRFSQEIKKGIEDAKREQLKKQQK